jgi:hypothetical protein
LVAYKNNPRFLPKTSVERILADLESKKKYSPGFILGADGNYYGNHFWLYSGLSAFLVPIVRKLGSEDGKAFQLLNILFIVGTSFYLLFLCSLPRFERGVLFLSYLFSGILFYLLWPQPEVFFGSSTFLIFVCFIEKKYLMSGLVAALTSMQLPPLIFLVPIMGLFGLKSFLTLSKKKKLAYAILIILFSTFSIFWSLYYIGVPNALASQGYSSIKNINWNRLHSIYLDLNQGIIVGLPGFFIVMTGVLVALAFKRTNEIFHRVNYLLIFSIMLALPAMSQSQWAAGHNVFQRYGIWVGSPLVIWVVWQLSGIKNMKLRNSLVSFLFLFQVLVFLYFDGVRPQNDSLGMKPWATWILDNYPKLYNPDINIFNSRVGNSEYFSSDPIAYGRAQHATKISVHQERLAFIDEDLCGINAVLWDQSSDSLVNRSELSFDMDGWGYLNGQFICKNSNGSGKTGIRKMYRLHSLLGGSAEVVSDIGLKLVVDEKKYEIIESSGDAKLVDINEGWTIIRGWAYNFQIDQSPTDLIVVRDNKIIKNTMHTIRRQEKDQTEFSGFEIFYKSASPRPEPELKKETLLYALYANGTASRINF